MNGTFVEVPVRKESRRAQLQFQLEEDINLPEMKPDLDVPVAQKWNVLIKDVKTGNGKVCVEGEIEYLILYAREDTTGRLEVLNGVFPFSQCLIMETGDKEDVETRMTISGEQVKKRNNRKLSVLLTMDLEAWQPGSKVQTFMDDTSEDVEKKIETLSILRLCDMGKELVSFKEIVALPSNRPDIGRVLVDQIQLRGVEMRLENGKILIKGEAFLFVLYESAEENTRMQYLELSVPVESEIECGVCREDLVAEYQYNVTKASLLPQPNEDGEERDFSLHIDMELCYELKEESEYQYLEDVYSLQGNVEPIRERMEFEKMRLRHSMRIRVSEMFSPPLEEKILQIFPFQGSVTLSEPEVVENGVLIEGIVHTDLLYFTANPSDPPAAAKLNLPFHQMVEDMGIQKPVRVQVNADIVQLSANVVDSRQAEIKGAVNLTVSIYESKNCSMVIGLQEGEESQREEQLPGMVGYIVQKGDRLWDLAKENRTTISEIREINQITQEELSEGEKILICRNA